MGTNPKDFQKSNVTGVNASIFGINVNEGASTAQMNDALRGMAGVVAAPCDFGDAADAILVDKIGESTANAGIELDGVKLKDGNAILAAIVDSNEAFLVGFKPSANPVNFVDVASADTGDDVELQAAGTDANVSINLVSKGTGVVKVNGQAIGATKAPTRQVFAPGATTWTRPDGCVAVEVELQGPGGGGGGSSSNNILGGGASAGGYCRKLIDVTSIASSTIAVGSAGVAGATNGNGGDGSGPTTWNDGTNTLTANQGLGGQVGGGSVVGVNGGNATGGDINIPGQDGTSRGGQVASLSQGNGGDSQLGNGGISQWDSAGGAAKGYGSGGAAGHAVSANRSGGQGADGVIIVTEHYG